ncbi:MAG: alpha/beta hydrolase [Syntrophales bacterium]|nr:alpha/beta hydrolase [Syntrophales bacterium]
MQNSIPVTPQSLQQSIGEVDISYLAYGNEGPPVVFLHATGFLPWLWHPIARELAPPYHVIAPYFCDHRESDLRRGGLGWKVLAQDVASLCRALSIDRPYLVGHSMGATVAALANALFGLNARGMILIEPIFLPESLYGTPLSVEEHPLASKSIKRTNHWPSREEALAYIHSRSLFQKWDNEMIELYVKYGMTPGDGGGIQLTCSPEREASLFLGGMQYDPWPEITKVSCPVLVLEGENSENRTFIDLKKITSLFSQGTYRLIEGAGHLIPMEQPQVVTNIIRNFFSK